MAKKPWLTMSRDQLADRLRRTPNNSFHRRNAKRLLKEDNDPIGAMEHLIWQGDCTEEHMDALKRWLAQEDVRTEMETLDPEDLA